MADAHRTPSERRLLEAVAADGEVWVVPSQYRVVRRLQRRGLVVMTDERRPNTLRGSAERRVVPGPAHTERRSDSGTSDDPAFS